MSGQDTQPTAAQDAIHDALRRANPDIEGDLMRKLAENGVDGPVRAMLDRLRDRPTRHARSRYVQGWRP